MVHPLQPPPPHATPQAKCGAARAFLEWPRAASWPAHSVSCLSSPRHDAAFVHWLASTMPRTAATARGATAAQARRGEWRFPTAVPRFQPAHRSDGARTVGHAHAGSVGLAQEAAGAPFQCATSRPCPSPPSHFIKRYAGEFRGAEAGCCVQLNCSRYFPEPSSSAGIAIIRQWLCRVLGWATPARC